MGRRVRTRLVRRNTGVQATAARGSARARSLRSRCASHLAPGRRTGPVGRWPCWTHTGTPFCPPPARPRARWRLPRSSRAQRLPRRGSRRQGQRAGRSARGSRARVLRSTRPPGELCAQRVAPRRARAAPGRDTRAPGATARSGLRASRSARRPPPAAVCAAAAPFAYALLWQDGTARTTCRHELRVKSTLYSLYCTIFVLGPTDEKASFFF